jgi:hypothetical protein
VPGARTGRMERKPVSAFVQVEALYILRSVSATSTPDGGGGRTLFQPDSPGRYPRAISGRHPTRAAISEIRTKYLHH